MEIKAYCLNTLHGPRELTYEKPTMDVDGTYIQYGNCLSCQTRIKLRYIGVGEDEIEISQ